MNPRGSDRNLLFGILALQTDLITRDALIDAMNAWVVRKHRSLAEILEERGTLSPADRALLEPLVRRNIEQHGGDPVQSLASISSVQWIRAALEPAGKADPDLQQSLDRLGRPDASGRRSDDPDATESHPHRDEWSGGRFRILRLHDRGGLGEVFVAKDVELHREVAYKQIRREHADHPGSRTRFLLEAEITGGLEHPGIVPVYGLGVDDDGRPYYAMRFIKGDSLRSAIDRFHKDRDAGDVGVRMLGLQKLLRRFLDVCNAVAYAHSRGVLHRDIKPGNIMVGQYGETLVVDWGLAKVVGTSDDPSAEATLRPPSAGGSSETLPGSAVGTPAFMSPEQAEGRLDQLGPASDVYSLGATLYYLLTGRVPIEERDTAAALEKVRRGEIRPPRQVKPDLPRPLDAICLKAMARKLEDRYPSPRALAEDLERWLADEPVSAWRDPLTDRALRWMRRHRTIVTGAAAALLAGLAGLGAVAVVQTRANDRLTLANAATTDAKNRAEAALERSEESRAQADAVSTFLTEAFRSPDPSQDGRTIRVIDVLDRAAERLDKEFTGSESTKGALLNALGQTYLGLGLYDQAGEIFTKACAVRASELGPKHPDTLTSRTNLAVAYLAAGRTNEAIRMHEQTLETMTSILGAGHPDTLTSRTDLAVAYLAAGRTAEAITINQDALRLHEAKLGADHPVMLAIRNNLAAAYLAAGRHAEAIDLHRANLELQESKLGPDHPSTLNTRAFIAADYEAAGRLAEALRMKVEVLKLRQSKLGPDHPDTYQSRHNLAVAYAKGGRQAEAVALHEATLGLRESKLGPNHPATLISRTQLASAYHAAGRLADAIDLYRATLAIQEAKLGPDHPDTLVSRNHLAAAYLDAGRVTEAIALNQSTLKIHEVKLGPDHPGTLTIKSNLAADYRAVGRLADAIALDEATLRLRETKLGPDHPDTLVSRNNLATDYFDAHRFPEAIRLHEETLGIQESKLGPDHPSTLGTRNNLATAYLQVGRVADAISLHEGTLKALAMKLGPDHPWTAGSRRNLAIAYLTHGRWAEAEGLFHEVLAYRRRTEKPDSVLLAGDLASMSLALLNQSKWSEAERLLRECLAIREKAIPEDWSRFNAMSQLGGALLGQGRLAEAEPPVVQGYAGMRARQARIPAPGQARLTEAAGRVVRLYEAWGKPDKAEAWRKQLREDLPDRGFPADPFAH